MELRKKIQRDREKRLEDLREELDSIPAPIITDYRESPPKDRKNNLWIASSESIDYFNEIAKKMGLAPILR